MFDLSPTAQIALETAAQGIRLFPFRPDKKPYQGFTNWQRWATTDPEQIRQWWIMYPEAMIAVPTGIINGFWVLDVDAGPNKQGLKSLHTLEQEYGPLPATMIVRTPSGGLHFYFQMPTDLEIRNSESGIAPHLDIRANGGLIIWPGSVRPEGKYEVIQGDWRTLQ
jgi:putative DNA primase/helicase